MSGLLSSQALDHEVTKKRITSVLGLRGAHRREQNSDKSKRRRDVQGDVLVTAEVAAVS